MQQELKATDDEWKAISPLLTKVMELQQATRMGGMRGPGGPGGAPPSPSGGAGGKQADRAPGGGPGMETPEAKALSTALAAKDSTNDQIRAAMKSLRDARAKQQQDLQKARQDLREVLSVRQEAQLVLAGLLD
jgi:hypothetical protein